MDKIKLTDSEKLILRRLINGVSDKPEDMSDYMFNASVRKLESLFLVKGAYIEGGDVEGVRLTNVGKYYVSQNPSLENPIDWELIRSFVGMITFFLGIILTGIGIALIAIACKN